MRTSAWWIAAGALSALVNGCADRGSDEGALQADIPLWQPEQTRRIGSLDHPLESLTEVSQVLLGPGGRVLVAQPMDGVIRLFDEAGTLAAAIGRPGEGPGEFGWLGPIGILADTLYAVDSGRRINFFDFDGRFLRSRPWTPSPVPGPEGVLLPADPMAMVLSPDGSALVIPGAEEPQSDDLGPGVRASTSRTPVLRIGPGGRVGDTIAWDVRHGALIGVASGGEMFFMPSPFSRTSLLRLAPGGPGVVAVRQGLTLNAPERPAFHVDLIGPEGDPVLSRAIIYTPLPLADADVSRSLESQPVFSYGPGDAAEPDVSEFAEALRDAGLLPANHLPVTGLAAGQDGSVWLRREEMLGDSVSWLVLDRALEIRGELRLPKGQRVLAAAGDRLATLELDALDLPYVVLYRLRR